MKKVGYNRLVLNGSGCNIVAIITYFSLSQRREQKQGNRRNFKIRGALAGVADLFLSVPKVTYTETTTKHGLFIEMKTKDGIQSDNQLAFQKVVELNGYQYAICRSIDEFMKTINDYL